MAININMSTNTEKEAAVAAKKAEKEAAAAGSPDAATTETIGDIEVGDPQSLRPVDLPLVVKPVNGGEWKNDAQATYAGYLNAYAYKNPKKWAVKKGDRNVGGRVIPGLISKLAEIGEDPSAITKYQGNSDGNEVKYSDKRVS